MDKWENAFMETAETFAKLSSARRLKVGAVIVKDNRIISIGYNGMPSGWDNNCENELKWPNGDVQFLETKPEVLHAEANAITKVAKSSESCYNADISTTTAPCLDCAKLIYQSGIKKVYWRTPHLRSRDGLDFLEKCDMEIEQI
jgi:dCMP deaminase